MKFLMSKINKIDSNSFKIKSTSKNVSLILYLEFIDNLRTVTPMIPNKLL